MKENTLGKTVNTAVMSVYTEEMKVNTLHQESRLVMLASMHPLQNNVANLASTTGWLVNTKEMLGCILGYSDCSLGLSGSSWGLLVSSWAMMGCSSERSGNNLGSSGNSLDWWGSSWD